MIWITLIIVAYMAGHWRGWGAGYEAGRQRGYVQGAEDQEYRQCRQDDEWNAIRRRVTNAELN